MTKLLETILRNVLQIVRDNRQIKKELSEIKEIVSQFCIEHPVNEQKAAEILELDRNTVMKYAREGKLDGTFTIGKFGRRMYFRSKLEGLK